MRPGATEFFPGLAHFKRLATDAADGTQWVSPEEGPARQVCVNNKSGVAIRVARLIEDVLTPEDYFTLADGEAWIVRGLTDASEVKIKRDDEVSAAVTVELEIEAW